MNERRKEKQAERNREERERKREREREREREKERQTDRQRRRTPTELTHMTQLYCIVIILYNILFMILPTLVFTSTSVYSTSGLTGALLLYCIVWFFRCYFVLLFALSYINTGNSYRLKFIEKRLRCRFPHI